TSVTSPLNVRSVHRRDSGVPNGGAPGSRSAEAHTHHPWCAVLSWDPSMAPCLFPRDTFWTVPLWVALGVAILAGSSDVGRAAEPPVGSAILQQLRSFASMGSVLYVAAHPDDENTQVIAYLARGRGYRTAYLSLTRGDGGQNRLGPQLGDALGVARTQELLAARRLDGGRQYFTRAKDFGYSKTADETLRVWDRQRVLGDMVYVIRELRPH